VIDVQAIRKQTAGCHDKLFFNSAGASLVSDAVWQTAVDYLNAERTMGGYETAAAHEGELAQFYTEAAQLLSCGVHNIAYTASATDGYGKVLSSIDWQPHDVILTSEVDYVSNYLQFISLTQRYAVSIERIPSMPSGDLDIEAAASIISSRKPRLVAVTHIPTNSGLVQDVVAVGELCRKYGVSYLIDGCQSLGQISVDMKQLHCDYYVASGRKYMRGPRGVGLLYVSDAALSTGNGPLTHDAHGSTWVTADTYKINDNASRYELFEHSPALKLAFTQAIRDINTIGITDIEAYVANIADRLRGGLSQLDDVSILDHGTTLCGIVTFAVTSVSTESISRQLMAAGVSHSISRRSSALIDFDRKGVQAAIRLSPHIFNTDSEVSKIVSIVQQSL